MIDTDLDLTQYKGGIVFGYIDIGKMPPQRVKAYLKNLQGELKPMIDYLEENGFFLLLLPRYATAERGHKWSVWGMNKPYTPSVDRAAGSFTGEDGKIDLDVVRQAVEASSRRLSP